MRSVSSKSIFVEVRPVVGDSVGPIRNRPANHLEARTAQRARRRLGHLIAKRDRLMKQIEALQNKCTHPTFYDIPGHPYDHRRCASCDRSLGLI